MDLCINILGRYGVHIDSAVSTSRLTKVMGTNSDMIKLNMIKLNMIKLNMIKLNMKQMSIDYPNIF